MHKKAIEAELCIKSVSETGAFIGYASVYGNKDSDGDVIVSGAFSGAIKAMSNGKKTPAMLWQHDTSQPIGVYTSLEEDSKGLKVSGELALATQKGKEAHELLKLGAISGLSVGFTAESDDVKRNDHGGCNIFKAELWEISLVTFPANAEARIVSVKNAMRSERDLERFLRTQGLSKRQSRAIVSKGYSGLQGDCDARLIDSIKGLAGKFKGSHDAATQ